MKWIAALPMYNVTDALANAWRDLLHDVAAQLLDSDSSMSIDVSDQSFADLNALWTRSDLLVSQTCGYPLMRGLPSSIQIVATPIYDAYGCDGPLYRSVIVVSESAFRQGATTIEACRGLRAAYNGDQSNSGMNMFRHSVAPYAKDGRFFSDVVRTGSHRGSLYAVAAGNADVSAIDCVAFAHMIEATAELTSAVKVIGLTEATPALPFVASARVNDAQLAQLRDALDSAVLADRERARLLKLKGFSRLQRVDYERICDIETRALELGYETLQ